MPFTLDPLPYAYEALEPHMSAKTLHIHHDKHHQKYVDKLNELIAGSGFEDRPLDEIIVTAAGRDDLKTTFNNAAQTWNHDFFWKSMTPGGSAPSEELSARIAADMGGLGALHDAFKAAAVGQFGSGWAWLVLDGGKLAVTNTANAGNPMTSGAVPLLTCDVWEHAYYLDYQNRRLDFVTVFLERLANWAFVEEQLAGAD